MSLLGLLFPINMETAFYTFEVWNSDGTQKVSGPELGLWDSQVVMRLPPQSLSIEQPFRADMGVDLAGTPVVVEGGFGPGRWTLRGSHGVGQQGLKLTGLTAPQVGFTDDSTDTVGFFLTQGLAKRTDLRNLFLAYSTTNKTRLQSKLKPYRLVFAVRGGPPSDFQNEEWWILPMGLPTDDRSASKPHDWGFSITFWALGRVQSVYSRPVKTPTFKEIIAGIKEAIKAVVAAIKGISAVFNGWIQTVRDVLSIATQAVQALSTIRTTVVADIANVCGLLDQAAYTLSLAQNVWHTTSVNSGVKQQVQSSMNNLRQSLGEGLLYLRTNQTATQNPASLPQKLPVVQGQDIRRMAAATYGDESLWPLIADKNGLVFPWVAWPDSVGNMPTPSLLPGTVAAAGSMVQPPSLADQEVLVSDPVGRDIDPAGSVDATGHLALVGGLANLRNALVRRLQTPRGYLPHHPEYGSLLKTFTGSPMDVPTLLSMRADVSRTLMQDPRVLGVSAVTVNANPLNGSVLISATARTVLGSLSVSTPALTS